MNDALRDLLMPYLREFAHEVAAILRGADGDMIDQTHSILGPRRHIAAVKRRLRAGDLANAAHVDRRYLLSPGAYREELQKRSLAKPIAKADGRTVQQEAKEETLAFLRGIRQ